MSQEAKKLRSLSASSSKLPKRSGFTLIELLTVIAIIGVLSTVGTVSYEGARASSRDTKRVSDAKTIQTGLEMFYEFQDYYPADSQPGPEGTILGQPNTIALTSRGIGEFSAFGDEQVYIQRLPKNPEPGGSPYVYRSLNRDGSDCNFSPCYDYAILFSLEKPQGSLLAGSHALTPQGVVGAEGGQSRGVTQAGGEIIGVQGIQANLAQMAEEAANAAAVFADNPTVEAVTQAGVAPAIAAAAVANSAVAAQATTSVAAGQYLLFFFTQPLLLFKRRRRKAWGTVYNSLSRLSEDLVIVRLREAGTGRVLRSEVTDKDGRFFFLVPGGSYVIEAVKANFEFPSRLLAEKKEDGQYLDLYHGENIEVSAEGGVLSPNIPIDPAAAERSDEIEIKADRWRRVQGRLAAVGPVLGVVSLVIKPTWFVFAMFLLQAGAYLFFRRFSQPTTPKNWGLIYDEAGGKSLMTAVVRIFALPYHKLLETKVTDARGRYNFKVGNAKYYLTATKTGYLKTESEPLDFSAITEPMIIASDMPLRRAGQPAPVAAVEKPPAANGGAGEPPPAA